VTVACVAGVGLLSTACGASKMPPVGYTPGAGDTAIGSLAPDSGAPAEATGLAVLGDFHSQMTRVTTGRIPSRGHAGGRWTAEVYADTPASAALLRAEGGASVVPAGTKFTEEHFERGDAGAGPIFLMEKRPPGFDPRNGDWRYAAVSSRGELVNDGPIESCAACHSDAPGDHLFRVSAVDGGALQEAGVFRSRPSER
jgi:hypothetical protein